MPDLQILKHFKEVIRQEFKLSRKKRVRICVHSLQFALQGVEFDLLFAKNMVSKNSSGGEFSLFLVSILIFEIKFIVLCHEDTIFRKMKIFNFQKLCTALCALV